VLGDPTVQHASGGHWRRFVEIDVVDEGEEGLASLAAEPVLHLPGRRCRHGLFSSGPTPLENKILAC